MKDIEKEQVVKNVPEIEIKAILPDDDIYITTDATRLKQVICNFINNARKFTEEGYIHFGFMVNPENDDSVCLFVEDTGKVFPSRMPERNIRPFYKVNTFKQGTGLGLSICKTIVEHLQGSISVVSEVGRGSRFYRYITTRKTAGGSLMSSVFLWGNTRMLLKNLLKKEILLNPKDKAIFFTGSLVDFSRDLHPSE